MKVSPVSKVFALKALKLAAVMETAMESAAAILEIGLDAVQVDLRAKPLIAHWLDWFPNQPPTMSRKECERNGGWGPTQEIALEGSGQLESFLDGAKRRITTKSFVRRMIALAIATYPLDGSERKARQPAARFQKAARPRTEAELAGLAKGNAARREGKQRREAEAGREANKAAVL
jgi:hypothetical protein